MKFMVIRCAKQLITVDIIVMDLQMPVLDGWEAARRIRSLRDPRKANIPIIAVSGNASRSCLQKCLDCGINELLAKPVSIEKLIVTIQRTIGNVPPIDL